MDQNPGYLPSVKMGAKAGYTRSTQSYDNSRWGAPRRQRYDKSLRQETRVLGRQTTAVPVPQPMPWLVKRSDAILDRLHRAAQQRDRAALLRGAFSIGDGDMSPRPQTASSPRSSSSHSARSPRRALGSPTLGSPPRRNGASVFYEAAFLAQIKRALVASRGSEGELKHLERVKADFSNIARVPRRYFERQAFVSRLVEACPDPKVYDYLGEFGADEHVMAHAVNLMGQEKVPTLLVKMGVDNILFSSDRFMRVVIHVCPQIEILDWVCPGLLQDEHFMINAIAKISVGKSMSQLGVMLDKMGANNPVKSRQTFARNLIYLYGAKYEQKILELLGSHVRYDVDFLNDADDAGHLGRFGSSAAPGSDVDFVYVKQRRSSTHAQRLRGAVQAVAAANRGRAFLTE